MRNQRHTESEIAAKLEEADALIAEGRLNRDIAKTLDISVMTYHRWRKTRESSHLAGSFQPDGAETVGQAERIRVLQIENSQLRRLVTDLMLEKINIEEAIYGPGADVRGQIRPRRG